MHCKHHPGNTRGLTDGQGNLVQEYFYDVYGKCWNVTKDSINGYRYLDGYGVSAAAGDGLLSLRARCQDPGSEVFISRDPIGLRGGLNLYGYVGNGPLTSIDPEGLMTSKDGRECSAKAVKDALAWQKEVIESLKRQRKMPSKECGKKYEAVAGTAWNIIEGGVITYFPAFSSLDPCVQDCGRVHEERHKYMYDKYGWIYGLYRIQAEIDAYGKSIECLEMYLRGVK